MQYFYGRKIYFMFRFLAKVPLSSRLNISIHNTTKWEQHLKGNFWEFHKQRVSLVSKYRTPWHTPIRSSVHSHIDTYSATDMAASLCILTCRDVTRTRWSSKQTSKCQDGEEWGSKWLWRWQTWLLASLSISLGSLSGFFFCHRHTDYSYNHWFQPSYAEC